MIATSIEQSQRLLELLDPKTADMFWARIASEDRLYVRNMNYDAVHKYQVCAAWSLSALLEVLPNNDYWDIYLCQAQDGKWQSVWNDCEISNGDAKDFIADTPIDAAYEMVCYLLEHGLIKKGGQDK